MNFVNLTPHALNIVQADGSVYTLPPSGQVARVATTRTVVNLVDDIEIYETQFGEVEGLPERNGQNLFIVSALVAQRANRADVYSPGELVRDGDGKVIGCRGLTR